MDERPSSPPHLRAEDDQTIEAHLFRIREKKANAIVPPVPLPAQSTPLSAPPTLGEFPEFSGFTHLHSLWLDEGLPRGTGHQEKGRSTAIAIGAGELASEKTSNPLLRATMASSGLQRRATAAGTKPAQVTHPVGQPLDRQAHSLDLTNVTSRDTLGSLSSLNSSFSESVTTLSGLLPAGQMRKRKLKPQPAPLAPEGRVPPTLASKSALGAEQKAVLIRRTRKLEQLLGETLGESQVERYVIDPSTAPATVHTRLDEKSWPRPSSQPEWEREDCVPRIASSPLPAVDKPARPSHQRTKSRLERARDMLLGPSTPPLPPQIQVFVARETHVAETGPRKVQPLDLTATSGARLAIGPASPMSPISPGLRRELEGAEDVAFRERRTRLSKLQRLLGAPVPPELLPSPYSTSNGPALPPEEDPTISTHSLPALDSQFHNRYGGAKIRHSASVSERRRSGNAPPGLTALVNSSPMPDDERKVALRRANKLDQMFGDAPPANLFLPAFRGDGHETHSEGGHASPPEQACTRPVPVEHEVYESYRHSIQGLIHLIEHDQTRLATIVDELTMATLVDEFGVSSPAPEALPQARRPTSPASPRLVRSLSKAKRWSVDMVRSMSPTASPTSPSRASGWPQHRYGPSSFPVSPTSPSAGSAESSSTSAGTRSSMGTRDGHSRDGHSRLPPIPHSPTTPLAELDVHTRRTAKLGRFFGEEGLDFSKPPPPVELRTQTPEPPPTRGRSQTLDSVLGELWRSVQTDMKRGGLRQADAARLNDLMRTLGRKRAAADGEWAEL
ncbi:hypothetical protein Q8F55_001133 [Vanrija albida]|uniref:Uncharacterized protein n=1 Tax=Vanrija albida TaxID=181172 RepID=A0ABR3QG51_9TREE